LETGFKFVFCFLFDFFLSELVICRVGYDSPDVIFMMPVLPALLLLLLLLLQLLPPLPLLLLLLLGLALVT
jgi:hypothetical protein